MTSCITVRLRYEPTNHPHLQNTQTRRLYLPSQWPPSHYSSSHKPNHESSFTKIQTKMKNASKATQWLQWVRACNVICHSLSSRRCNYGTGEQALSDEMVASDRRSWAGTRKCLAHLQSVTLDPGILQPMTAVQMLRDCGGLFTCTLVCVCVRNRHDGMYSHFSSSSTRTHEHTQICLQQIRVVLF